MVRFFNSLIAKADAWPPRTVLLANLVLAGFVFVAHSGALLALRAHPTPNAPDVKSIALVSLPFAALVLLTAVLGLALPRFRSLVLAFHGAMLLLAATVLFIWGVSLLIFGIPTNVRFSWSVGFFTATIAYAVYGFTRYSLPVALRVLPAVTYLPLIALFVSAIVDVGVFIRLAHGISV